LKKQKDWARAHIHIIFYSDLSFFLRGLVQEVHKCGRSSKYLIYTLPTYILFRFQLFHFRF
jgi:hypothetical protein